MNYTIQIRHLWHHYYQNTDAVIYVVDSSDSGRIACATMDCNDCAKEELHYLLQRDELRFFLIFVPFLHFFAFYYLLHFLSFLCVVFLLYLSVISWYSGAVLLVYANKQDLQGAATAAELRDKLELDKVCKDRSWYVQPCCALTGDGLLHGLEWLAQELKKVKG